MSLPTRFRGVSAAFAALLLSASAGASAGPEAVEEVRPGLLAGYLSTAELPDSSQYLPPPPGTDSAGQALDEQRALEFARFENTERWELAASDNDVSFPVAAGIFSCAAGLHISEERTPFLYQVLRRTLTDAAFATGPAKDAYRRERPFVKNGKPTCTPEDEQKARHSPSYPSGHAAAGWAWALLLSALVPERAEPVLARGLAFGESRAVCNLHWHSDVVAGQLVGAAVFARLQSDDVFRRDFAGAQQEVARARALSPAPLRDCAVEMRVLSVRP